MRRVQRRTNLHAGRPGPLDAPKEAPVTIVEYSPEWPSRFAAEAAVIRAAFAGIEVRIEHVGSTAVPGLASKPIIDILLGADSLAAIERRIRSLEASGYRDVPEFEKQLPQRRYFVKPDRGDAHFHLHAVERGGPFWSEQLAFRDALRRDPGLRDRYVDLKRRLAAAFRTDRAA